MKNKYYKIQSQFSDPVELIHLYNSFADEISTLTDQAQGLFLHYADMDLLSIDRNKVNYNELNLRTMSAILKSLQDKSPINFSIQRDVSHRVMGVCRDTSLLVCSVLRSRGVAARLRSGFVNYFIPGLFLDGFCLEFFDENIGAWRAIDTRTTQLHIDHYNLNIDFDLMNVPNDRFIYAANAWQMCRSNNADPVRFGSRQHRGLFTVRNRMIHDLALLNKQEILIWDLWGAMLTSSVTDFELLDALSDLLLNHCNDLDKINNFYADHDSLKVSNTILVDNPFLEAQWIALA
jgi:hypothetical protein